MKGIDDTFCLFYDESFSQSTPYSSDNDYVRKTAPRVENTISLLPDLNGCTVLDLGASPFYFLYRCKKLGADWVSGIFFSNDAHPLAGCSEAYTEHGTIDIFHSDLLREKLPYDDDSFDIIGAMEIFEHFPMYPSLLLSEITRVIKPGGLFFITVPNIHRLANIAKLLLKRNIFMPYRSDTSGRHAHEYTKAQVMALTEESIFGKNSKVRPVFTRNGLHSNLIQQFVSLTPLVDWLAPVWFGSTSLDKALGTSEIGFPKALYDEAESIEHSL